jgi:hypothetical protein
MTVPPKLAALRRSKSHMGRRALACLGVLATFGLAACPEPTNGEPQIPVAPGLDGRLNYMRGHGLPNAPKAKPTQAPLAHAHPMKPSERLGGPNATG